MESRRRCGEQLKSDTPGEVLQGPLGVHHQVIQVSMRHPLRRGVRVFFVKSLRRIISKYNIPFIDKVLTGN
jgi:hypothetical protein